MKKILTGIILFAFFLTWRLYAESVTPVSQPNIPIHTIEAPTYGTGKIVVEYFRDYQCPPCRIFTLSSVPTLERLVHEWKITLIYRQYPLTSIHQNSYRDALAALCAAEQDEYLKYSQKIYTLEYRRGGKDISDTQRIALLRGAHIDKKQFRKCLTSERYASRIDADTVKWDLYGVESIPAIVVDGKLLNHSDITSVDVLEALIIQ